MKRRAFFGSSLVAGTCGLLGLSCSDIRDRLRNDNEAPLFIGDLTLDMLREDLRARLFDRYLPFWDNGGIDRAHGGFFNILNDNGIPVVEEKNNAVQGGGLWVYSALYHQFGNNEEYLATAGAARAFMVERLHAGRGIWHRSVAADGTVIEQAGTSAVDVLAWLHIAEGLIEYIQATDDDTDMRLVIDTIWAVTRTYDDAGFDPGHIADALPPDIPRLGLRSLEVTSALIRVLSRYLSFNRNRKLENLLVEHLDHAMIRFFNPATGVMNPLLTYQYERIGGYADSMHAGTAMDTVAAVLEEGLRSGDTTFSSDAATLTRRYLEMAWDPVFEGFGGGMFSVFDGPDRTRDALFGIKHMRRHATLLGALQRIVEYTWEPWAIEWYGRAYEYTIQHFDTESGIWRNEINRFGAPIIRSGDSARPRDLFHQPRCLMLNLLSVERMLEEEAALNEGGEPPEMPG